MRTIPRYAVLASTAMLLTGSATAQDRKDMFNNEQVTLACQQYVNSLYPASSGSADREREAAFRACLQRGGK